jgi:hypothetical protein
MGIDRSKSRNWFTVSASSLDIMRMLILGRLISSPTRYKIYLDCSMSSLSNDLETKLICCSLINTYFIVIRTYIKRGARSKVFRKTGCVERKKESEAEPERTKTRRIVSKKGNGSGVPEVVVEFVEALTAWKVLPREGSGKGLMCGT